MGFFDLFRRQHSRSAQIPKRTLSESERVALAIKALGAHLSADSDPREIAAFGFCGALLEEPFVPQFLASLPTDTANQLPSANRIESHIFELWLWSHTLRRLGSLEKTDLVAVLDAFHLYVYRALVLLGMTEAEIMDLQKRLPSRYEEYDDLYSAFWTTGEVDRLKAILPFARQVIKNIFGVDTENIRLLSTIGIQVNTHVISTGEAFKDLASILRPRAT